METNLLDRMLTLYQSSAVTVTITLQNKIRVTGAVKAFDSYVIVVDGQKREIVYRHAVSCLAASSGEEVKKQSVPVREKSGRPARTPARPQKASLSAKPAAASTSDSSINNSMKEGLLKWMQEQKAAK